MPFNPGLGPAPEPPRYNVLGVGISALTLDRARDLVLGVHGTLRHGYICVTGVHGVMESQDDPATKRIHNEAWLVTPDGMPLVWLGPPGVTRVYGPDLMLAVCDAGRDIGLRHYFYGGAPGIAATLAEKLTARFPGLVVAGTFTPPFRPLADSELAEFRADVARTRPDVLWVGLSTPKQERFMAEHWRSLDAGVLIGVGAAFDFHAGRVRQAPRWIQRGGLEWLFRLCTEPRRLGPRYLRNNPRFVALVFLQLTGLRKYPLVLPRASGITPPL
ncbi:MAG TPA: WecB/TagA/CpsF family glycosyltransferase [Opitutus sp.]|nr:WecB/TagA/CpsF family glycosyltransferase [Opitutus sp.]